MAVIEGNILYILKTRQRTDHKKYSNFRVKLPKTLLFSVLYCLFGLTRSTKTRKKTRDKSEQVDMYSIANGKFFLENVELYFFTV